MASKTIGQLSAPMMLLDQSWPPIVATILVPLAIIKIAMVVGLNQISPMGVKREIPVCLLLPKQRETMQRI